MALRLLLVTAFMISSVWAEDYIAYTCNSSRITVDFSNMNDSLGQQAALVPTTNTSGTEQCTVNMTNITSSTQLTPTNCNYTGDWILYLRTSATGAETNLGINDGIITKYHLTCDTYEAWVNRTVVVGLESTPIAVLPTILSMTTSPKNVSLGDKVTVSITDQSTDNHILHIQSCNASDEDGKASILMIEDGTKMEPNLVDTINATGNTSVGFTFYGFRFLSSSQVELKCTVQVCLRPTNCTSTTTSSGKRTLPAQGSNTGSSTYHLSKVIHILF